jgi:hypothetical protein
VNPAQSQWDRHRKSNQATRSQQKMADPSGSAAVIDKSLEEDVLEKELYTSC